jgi:hypothetical protein
MRGTGKIPSEAKNERLDCSIRDCGIDPGRMRRSVAFAQCDILFDMWRTNAASWRLFDVRRVPAIYRSSQLHGE